MKNNIEVAVAVAVAAAADAAADAAAGGDAPLPVIYEFKTYPSQIPDEHNNYYDRSTVQIIDQTKHQFLSVPRWLDHINKYIQNYKLPTTDTNRKELTKIWPSYTKTYKFTPHMLKSTKLNGGSNKQHTRNNSNKQNTRKKSNKKRK